MKFVLGDFDNPKVRTLIARHMQGMQANTPPQFVFALDLSRLQTPDISFYCVWEGEELLGIGALKSLGDQTGELKSMRTADAHLRKGVGGALLDFLIAEAKARRYTTLFLETGCGEAFEPALNLYRTRGFVDCEAFSEYEPNPYSHFMRREM